MLIRPPHSPILEQQTEAERCCPVWKNSETRQIPLRLQRPPDSPFKDLAASQIAFSAHGGWIRKKRKLSNNGLREICPGLLRGSALRLPERAFHPVGDS